MPSYYRDPAAPAPNVPRRIGAVALIERDGSYLLERRSDDGSWGFPGGSLDEDESILDALRREVLEETSLRVDTVRLFGIFSDPTRIIEYPDGNVCRVFSVVFHVRPRAGDEPAASDESLELRWFCRAELATVDLFPVQRPILDALLSDGGDVVVA